MRLSKGEKYFLFIPADKGVRMETILRTRVGDGLGIISTGITENRRMGKELVRCPLVARANLCFSQ